MVFPLPTQKEPPTRVTSIGEDSDLPMTDDLSLPVPGCPHPDQHTQPAFTLTPVFNTKPRPQKYAVSYERIPLPQGSDRLDPD